MLPGGCEEEEEEAIFIYGPRSEMLQSHFDSSPDGTSQISNLMRWLGRIALSVVILVGGLDAAASESHTLDSWYRVDVGETQAGWMFSRESRQGDRLTTTSSLHLRFKRGTNEQSLSLDSRFVETLDGRPLSAWSRQDLGLEPVESTWTFEPGGIMVNTTHGGESRQERVPWPAGDWLTPGQLQARLIRFLSDGSETFSLASLDPQLGLEIINTEWRLEAKNVVLDIHGQERTVTRFRQRQNFTPQLETRVHVDSAGLIVRSVTLVMGLEMMLTLSTREQALASQAAPELLVRSFLYPDRPILKPRQLQRASYEIFVDSGAPPSLPSIGHQRVTITPEGARVVVELGSSPRLEGEHQPDPRSFLAASTYLDHHDAGIRRLLDEASLAPEADTSARAEALRRLVARTLSEKNLDSVLATASEAAESRSGDCTEHSVLLAALLRAEGIPSRVVTGIVYVEEFVGEKHLFGYHMWAQALIEQRWIDLDATLTMPFDAAHVAFSSSALNDGASTIRDLAEMATLIGRAKIRVLETEY